MQLENQVYKQEAPHSTSWSDLWPVLMTVIIGRSLASMKEGFQLFEEASKEAGFVINEDKTNYMVAANTQICSKPHAIEIRR